MKKIVLSLAVFCSVFTIGLVSVPSAAKAMTSTFEYMMFNLKKFLHGLSTIIEGINEIIESFNEMAVGSTGGGRIQVDYATLDRAELDANGIIVTETTIQFTRHVIADRGTVNNLSITPGTYQVDENGIANVMFEVTPGGQ